MQKSQPAFTRLNSHRNFGGFTIVELLVVIVVIAILAAITIVSYTGITGKAVASGLQSDLDNNSKLLKMYYADYGSYPTMDGSNCPATPNIDSKYCLKPSNGNALNYTNLLGTSFKLIATKDTTKYYITSDTSPNNKNLLYLTPSADDVSFEDGTIGGWVVIDGNITLTNSTDWVYRGTHSSKIELKTATQNGIARSITTITTAGGQFTLSFRFKPTTTTQGKTIYARMWDNVTGHTYGSPVIADIAQDYQVVSVTKTFDTSSTIRYGYLLINGTAGNEVLYTDAIQLESGSTATPF